VADDAVLLEAAPIIPANVLSPAWGALLSLGGLVLVLGSLGYAVVQMSTYETEIASLRSQLSAQPDADAAVAEPSPEPIAAPSETPSAPPTVVVTETVAATPEPRATPRAVPGSADIDRTPQLQAQVISLQSQLQRTQAELDAAKRESAANADAAKQCNSRLDRTQAAAKDAQALLDRLQTVCRAANVVRPPTVRPQ
jgi:hypothetical protein